MNASNNVAVSIISSCAKFFWEGSRNGSQGKARGTQEARLFIIIVRRMAQGVLRAYSGYSGSDQIRPPSAQVKAAAAHVQRLKRIQRG